MFLSMDGSDARVCVWLWLWVCQLAEYRLTEMELGRGMGHLCDALQYSHYVARRLHLNISPDSIFINPQVRTPALANGPWA